MKLGTPAEIKVIERRKDGRGGIVEIPIVAETPMVDFSRTAGGGSKNGKLTLDDLREMATNFPSYPGPVTVGAGSHVRDSGDAAPGFVESVTLRGTTLWARLDLGPGLFASLVDGREWRGFSIEAAKNLAKPTVTFQGWVLVGGVFTNNPALDVNFKIPDSIAASVGEAAEHRIISVALQSGTGTDLDRGQEQDMDDKTISLASHEAKIQEVKDAAAAKQGDLDARLETATTQVTSLTERTAKLQERVEELDQELASVTIERDALKATQSQTVSSKDATIANLRSELNKRTTQLTEMELTSREATKKALSVDVRTLVLASVEAGVPAAEFDGYEADPAMWLEANFASLESFQAHCKRRQATAKLSVTTAQKSGSDPNADGDEEDSVKLSAEEEKVLRKLGLLDVPAYETAGSATEAASMKQSEKKSA